MKKSKKAFDCVEFKRKAQCEIYEQIKGLPASEEIAWFQRKAASGRLGEWWQNVSSPNAIAGSAVAESKTSYGRK